MCLLANCLTATQYSFSGRRLLLEPRGSRASPRLHNSHTSLKYRSASTRNMWNETAASSDNSLSQTQPLSSATALPVIPSRCNAYKCVALPVLHLAESCRLQILLDFQFVVSKPYFFALIRNTCVFFLYMCAFQVFFVLRTFSIACVSVSYLSKTAFQTWITRLLLRHEPTFDPSS